jgi:hypothetical protein
MKLEAPISKEIQKYLKSIGVFFYRSQVYQGNTKTGAYLHTGVKGLADITCILPSKLLFIETKKADGVQSTAQLAFMWRVRQLDHYYLVARSVEDVATYLEELDYK